MVSKKKRFTLSVLLIIVTFFCVACFPTGKETMTENTGSQDLSELNHSDNEMVVYDFNTNWSIPDICYTLSGSLKTWDEKLLREIFFGDKDDGTYQVQWQQPSGYISDEVEGVYILEDETLLHYDVSGVEYDIDNEGDWGMLSSLYAGMLSDGRMREFFPKNSLESFSSENAVGKMNELISFLALPIECKPEIFALDEEGVLKMSEANYGWINYSEDAYLISYHQSLENVPLVKFHMNLQTIDLPMSCMVYGIFNKDGLISFSCRFVPDNMKRTSEFSPCSLSDAVMKIKERMNSKVITVKTTISGGELMYFPERLPRTENPEYKLKPMWFFIEKKDSPVQYGGDENGIRPRWKYIVVDAETGTVIE